MLFQMTEHKEYSRDGVLVIEGQFDNNRLKTGLWKEYYNSGKIAAIEVYEDGKLHGCYKSFHENGSIWAIGYYNHGNKEGKFEIYDPQGNLILIQHYNQDNLINQVTPDK